MRSESSISLNTQAILLLTAPLIIKRGAVLSPDLLAPKEYKQLAQHLRKIQHQPADFLTPNMQEVIEKCQMIIDKERLHRLLGRGFLLAQAIEHWHARAIWVVSRADKPYPSRFKAHLREDAPAILYGCGDISLLEKGGLAVVGSRNAEQDLLAYSASIGQLAAKASLPIVSGGAKGIDESAMLGALNTGGEACGVIANNLEQLCMQREYRDALLQKRLVLISPYDPNAGFNVGHAMQRNKLIYALSDAGLVVSTDLNKGGTWAGAIEQLDKFQFVPLFVRSTGEISAGLNALRQKGAKDWANPSSSYELTSMWTGVQTAKIGGEQVDLFSMDNGVINEKLTPETDNIQENKTDNVAETLFSLVRDLILSQLNKPMKEEDIAKMLNVSTSQTKIWLKRLIDTNDIQKLTRPIRYIKC